MKEKVYRARPVKRPSEWRLKVKQCPMCLRVFATQAKTRTYCNPHHRFIWNQYNYLLRKKEAGKIRDWEIGLLERIENYIHKVREEVKAEMEAEKKGQEGKKGGGD